MRCTFDRVPDNEERAQIDKNNCAIYTIARAVATIASNQE